MNTQENEPVTAISLFQQRASTSSGAALESSVARASQEVQAAMVIAKKFPRDETAAFTRIMNACKRKGLAESALYAYPRGGTTVTGPSIRLAEALVQNWGNVDFGIIELEQKNGESQVMSYAWDLETNTRQTKVFAVKHERKANGAIKKLDDPRDIYEMVANQGARRLRACILGVIPGDVVDAAVEACDTTLKTGNKEPLIDRVRKMVGVFQDYGVTQPMIEGRLGHNLDAISEQEFVNLRKIFVSIKDGAAKRDDFFKPDGAGATADPKKMFAEGKAGDANDNPPGLEPQKEAPPALTPQQDLARFLNDDCGVSFDDARSFIGIKGLAKDTDSWASWDEIPDQVIANLRSQTHAKALDELVRKFGKKK